jgi:hypothetical protein
MRRMSIIIFIYIISFSLFRVVQHHPEKRRRKRVFPVMLHHAIGYVLHERVGKGLEAFN